MPAVQESLRGVALIAASLALAAVAAAQVQPRPKTPDPRRGASDLPLQTVPRPPARRTPLVYDRVVGIIGDRVLLESKVRERLEPKLTDQARDKPLSRSEVRTLRREILTEMYRDLVLAQGARTLRGTTREQVDALVESFLAEERRERIRRAGSVNKLTDQLGFLGMSLDTVEEERRNQLMADLAYDASLRRRVQDQQALLVTPREMKRFYRDNPGLFRREAAADVAIFVTAERDGAAGAAAAWRDPATTPDQLTERFGGSVLPTQTEVRSAEDDARGAFLKEFAAAAPLGTVSDPIARGEQWWVLKVVRRQEAENQSFDDPDVQRWIMSELLKRKESELRSKLILRNLRGLQAWIPELQDGR